MRMSGRPNRVPAYHDAARDAGEYFPHPPGPPRLRSGRGGPGGEGGYPLARTVGLVTGLAAGDAGAGLATGLAAGEATGVGVGGGVGAPGGGTKVLLVGVGAGVTTTLTDVCAFCWSSH